MLTYNELLNEVKQRPPAEQLTLLEELAHLLREELLTVPTKPENETASNVLVSQTSVEEQAQGWPVGYFEQTFGSLRDVNLERQPQGEYEIREPID